MGKIRKIEIFEPIFDKTQKLNNSPFCNSDLHKSIICKMWGIDIEKQEKWGEIGQKHAKKPQKRSKTIQITTLCVECWKSKWVVILRLNIGKTTLFRKTQLLTSKTIILQQNSVRNPL